MELVDISIIIVTYNSRELIVDCIQSILDYNDLDKDRIEIIIVDNSPIEEYIQLKELVMKTFSQHIVLIHNPINGGYGQGNNVGAEISKGKILAIMNPDVRLMEPLFKASLETFEKNHVGSLGYKQITGGLDFSFFQKPEFFLPIISSIRVRNLNKNNLFNEKKYYLSGAFVFFRKTDFIKIGKYDENMFMYFEEPDMARRLKKIGKISVFDPSKKYQHLMEQKDDYNEWLLDVGADSLKVYYSKFNLNLQRHLKLIFTENYIFILIFSILGKRDRIEKCKAVIRSLQKLKK